jgi:hypothetical protein
MRAGIAIDSQTETRSIDEMRFIKESWEGSHWTCKKNALFVVDRAFVFVVFDGLLPSPSPVPFYLEISA